MSAIKSVLESLPVDTRLILEAIGTQLNCNSQVDGSMFDFRSMFDEAWCDFANLAIQSIHNSASAVLIITVSAVDPSILLPVADSPLPTCRQQDVRYVRVSCTIDFARLISIPDYLASGTIFTRAMFLPLRRMLLLHWQLEAKSSDHYLKLWLNAQRTSVRSNFERGFEDLCFSLQIRII